MRSEPIKITVDVQADTSKVTPTGLLVAAVVGRMLGKVEQFNREVRGQIIPEKPRSLTAKEGKRAVAAFQEEIAEFTDAVAAKDPIEQADALLDLVFFALGRLAEMGVPAQAVMDEIDRANMSKERGSLTKRKDWEGYDAVKPEGWVAPDHSWLLSFSLADLRKARAYDALSPVLKECHELRMLKGSDYDNVPGGKDSYFPFGHYSYVHMLVTKTKRIQSIVNHIHSAETMAPGHGIGVYSPNFEGLYDSARDLLNYATYYAEAIRDDRVRVQKGGEPGREEYLNMRGFAESKGLDTAARNR